METKVDDLDDKLDGIELMIINSPKMAGVPRRMERARVSTVGLREISPTVVPKNNIRILVLGSAK